MTLTDHLYNLKGVYYSHSQISPINIYNVYPDLNKKIGIFFKDATDFLFLDKTKAGNDYTVKITPISEEINDLVKITFNKTIEEVLSLNFNLDDLEIDEEEIDDYLVLILRSISLIEAGYSAGINEQNSFSRQ